MKIKRKGKVGKEGESGKERGVSQKAIRLFFQ